MADLPTTPLCILIVDDEPLIGRALARRLRGHRLHLAENYASAAEILRREPVDMVVSDCHMPGPNGVEVLRLTRELQPEARRVMLSAHPPANLEELCEDGLIERFFAKPWQPEMVEALLALVPR